MPPQWMRTDRTKMAPGPKVWIANSWNIPGMIVHQECNWSSPAERDLNWQGSSPSCHKGQRCCWALLPQNNSSPLFCRLVGTAVPQQVCFLFLDTAQQKDIKIWQEWIQILGLAIGLAEVGQLVQSAKSMQSYFAVPLWNSFVCFTLDHTPWVALQTAQTQLKWAPACTCFGHPWSLSGL